MNLKFNIFDFTDTDINLFSILIKNYRSPP